MRIMIINTYYFPEIMGGAEYSVKKLAETLSMVGHTVKVLCTGDNYKQETIDGVDVVRIVPQNICRAIYLDECSKVQKALHKIQEVYNKRNDENLEKEIEKFKPDVIHTNGLYDITPVVWKIAKKKNIRVVHTLRDYYLYCHRVSMSCKKRPDGCSNPLLLCKLRQWFNIIISRNVDVVTAPSKNTLNILLERKFFENAKSKVILNATNFSEDLLEENLSKRLLKLRDGCSFVYLGTLSEQKGIRWLINSFTEFENPDAKLFIAGKGTLEQYVHEASINDSRIHFVGFLNEQDMNALLADMDVVVCPSLWQEPFGRVVLDAYKNAMPVIVSDRGALPELVDDRKTGLVASPDNEKSLINAFAYFCDNIDNLNSFYVNAVDKVRHYSLSRQIEEFIECYKG